MIRYVAGWQLHAYVEQGMDGPEGVCIAARHLVGDVFHITRFTSNNFGSAAEATDYIDAQLLAVTDVEPDGRLRFSSAH